MVGRVRARARAGFATGLAAIALAGGALAVASPGRHSAQAAPATLWGVDTAASMISDWSAVTGGSGYGTPQFWGRYLGDGSLGKDMSSAEPAFAASHGVLILPVYFQFCSVSPTYAEGTALGQNAIRDAQSGSQGVAISAGTAIFIDIEPPANTPCAQPVTGDFLRGWFDALSASPYVAGYYGNGTASSAFASAYCAAVAAEPAMGSSSYIWAYIPTSSRATPAPGPAYNPSQPSCAANVDVWQYAQPGLADEDEAVAGVPLWNPGGGSPTPTPAPTPTPTPTPAPSSPPYPGAPLQQGSTGAAVAEVQAALHLADSGSFDAATTSAVQAYQAANGLTVDGVVGQGTWDSLFSTVPAFPPAALRQGSSGPDVAAVQRRLGIGADGVFGPQTKRAVQGFQSSTGLTADGIVGHDTWSGLFSAVPVYPGAPLRQGSSGANVVLIQNRLGISADGAFGPQTKEAVQSFQASAGLSADGVVGPLTWRALFG
jgi:peptidoglycan hydrolase-like protein with peptidoglycan-binding domain